MALTDLFGGLARLRRARPQSFTSRLEPGQALWLLSLFATLYRRHVDASLLVRECLPPLTGADLERIAGQIGLDVTLQMLDARSAAAAIARDQCPVAVELRGEGDSLERECTDWAVVLDANGSLAMLANRSAGHAQTVATPTLLSRMTGAWIRLRPHTAAANDPDGAGATRRPPPPPPLDIPPPPDMPP